MHTLVITASGLALLGVFVLLGHLRVGRVGQARAARAFVPVWFVLALLNVSVGVLAAGYTVMQEVPVFLVTFAIPAGVALVVARGSTGSA